MPRGGRLDAFIDTLRLRLRRPRASSSASRPSGSTRSSTGTRPSAIGVQTDGNLAGASAATLAELARADRRRPARDADRARLPARRGPRGLPRARAPPHAGQDRPAAVTDMTGPMSETLSVCIAGATGWTGPALVRGVLEAPDLALRSAVSRSAAGRDLGEALGGDAARRPGRRRPWPRRWTASTSSSTTRRRPRSRRTCWRRSRPAWPS